MNFDTRGLNVMVAEPDRTVLEMLQIRLDVAGFHTSMARTGPMALETLKTCRPAALILELNLPGMSGFEILQALNPRGRKLAVPTLVMGKNLMAEDIQRALSLGARDCLMKPFSGAQMLDRVSRLLRPPAPPPPQNTAYI